MELFRARRDALDAMRAGREPDTKRLIAKKQLQCLGQRMGITWRNQNSLLIVTDDFSNSSHQRGDGA